MTPLSKQYVMHCRDATYSRKITLIIFHRIIAWKKLLDLTYVDSVARACDAGHVNTKVCLQFFSR